MKIVTPLMRNTAQYFKMSLSELRETDAKTGLTREELMCKEVTDKHCLAYMNAYDIQDALRNALRCAECGYNDIIILRSVVRKNCDFVVLAQKQTEAPKCPENFF